MEIWVRGMGHACDRGDWSPQLVFRQGCGVVAETAVASVSAELLRVCSGGHRTCWLLSWNWGQRFEYIVGQWILYLIPLFLIIS